MPPDLNQCARLLSVDVMHADAIGKVVLVCFAESEDVLNAFEAQMRTQLDRRQALGVSASGEHPVATIAVRGLATRAGNKRDTIRKPEEMRRAIQIFQDVLRGASYAEAGERSAVSGHVASQRFRLVRRLIVRHRGLSPEKLLTQRMTCSCEPEVMRADADGWIALSGFLMDELNAVARAVTQRL
jgi:hypothetical protein